MTPYGRDEAPRPFTPAELEGADGGSPDEMAAVSRVARELEALADRGGVRPSADFADRVMRSIASEPSPAPVMAAGAAVRRGSMSAVLSAVRDAVRVAFGAGFPVAVRAQALALVLVVTGVLATGSGMATVGAVQLLGGNPLGGNPDATDQPVAPAPSATPDGSLEPFAPFGSPEPSEPGEPSASDHPDASASDEPGETPDGNGNDGNGNGGSGGNGHGGRPTAAPDASGTPEPHETDHHDRTPPPDASPSPTADPSAPPVPFPSMSPAG